MSVRAHHAKDDAVKNLSELENSLALQIRALKLPVPEREYRFCERRWRFDFAFIANSTAVEVEGGSWVYGAHQRPQKFRKDCEKYNEAALLGWLVLRVTGDMIEDGTAIELLKRALTSEGGNTV